MATDAPICDCKAKLTAIGAIAFAGVEIKPSLTQPCDSEILEGMANGEDAQRLSRELLPLVLGRMGEFKLQSAFAGVAQTRTTQIVTGVPGWGFRLSARYRRRRSRVRRSWACGCNPASEGYLRLAGDLEHLCAEGLDGDED